MKTILCLFLTFGLCLVNAEELSGWEQIVAHKEGQVELSALPEISVAIEKEKVLVTVKNKSESDLVYSGYGKSSPQLFMKKMENGKWVSSGWHWCGTGMEEHTLAKGETVVFELHSPNVPTQFFAILRDAKNPKAYSLIKLYELKG
jgi:hypothetical protein